MTWLMGEPGKRGRQLKARYTTADLSVLTDEEARRFLPGGDGDPRTDVPLAWELLYRLEPELYERLISAERLHPQIIDWLPRSADRIVEVGAGTGRLTIDLLDRGREVLAIEPAAGLRRILTAKLARADRRHRVRVCHGFFDDLPVPDNFADLVIACSAFTAAAAHGGEAGLAEMERICRPGGCVAVVWPNDPNWLAEHEYQYRVFAGEMAMEFGSHREAIELAEIFYPRAVGEVRRRGSRRVPYAVLGIKPPHDVAFRVMPNLPVICRIAVDADSRYFPVRNLTIAAASALAILRWTRDRTRSLASAAFLMLPHSTRTFGMVVRLSPARSSRRI
jgi:SAM-dependent methyltransferase